MELVKNNIYFSKRFGFIIYIGGIFKNYNHMESWKFLNLNNTEIPIYFDVKNSLFYCSVKSVELEKLPENTNENTIQILYGANSE